MRRYMLVSFVLLVFLALGGCSEDRGLDPQSPADPGTPSAALDPELVAKEIVAKAGWPAESEDGAPLDVHSIGIATPGCVIEVERQPIVGDVVHYSFRLEIGPGEHEAIVIHRVVRERCPYRPISARKNVFLQHGDAVGFAGVFLFGAVAPSVADDHAFAVYLAQNDVDVWGVDQPWVLVPQGTTDFTFMQNWGMQYHIDNLEIALAVARFTRLLTGSGFGKMNLLGYSSGAALGYAYLNEESQKSVKCTHVNGYIPVDMAFKTDDPALEAVGCAFGGQFMNMVNSGIYQSDVPFQIIAYLALTDPDGDSPLAPGYTNYTVALLFGSATHLFSPFTPWFHYIAGTFDEMGMPTGFQYTTVDAALDFLLSAAPYEALLFQAEYLLVLCGTPDLPFDDNLADITVPVMNVGAAGGLGTVSDYTLTLLGSTDVTNHLVQLYPPEYIAVDFGHVDIFIADNAPSLVWEPVLMWINEHTSECGFGKKKPKD